MRCKNDICVELNWNDIEMKSKYSYIRISIYIYIILPSSTDHGRYILVVILFGLLVDVKFGEKHEWLIVVEKYLFVVGNYFGWNHTVFVCGKEK